MSEQTELESVQLLKSELENLRARYEALENVLAIGRRVLGCRRSDPEMHNRLAAFSTAIRAFEHKYGPNAGPEQPAGKEQR